MSNQIDIILYDKSILPPVLFDETTGIFPIEAALYVIEVKSKLTMKDLRVAHDSASFLETFGFLPVFFDQNGQAIQTPAVSPISVLFGLDSTLTGSRISEAKRYKGYYGEINRSSIKAIFIAGKGYTWMEGFEF
ncbi:hypothetical protein LZT24_20335 [Aeromonas veronii]|nr:hypothetical protein [Aeromonas veronii]